jgi:hypothetical protein
VNTVMNLPVAQNVRNFFSSFLNVSSQVGLSANQSVGQSFSLLVTSIIYVRFEVFTAVTMKNGVFWDVRPCDSCKNRRFGGT